MQDTFDPQLVLGDKEVMELAKRVHRKAVDTATATDASVLAVQALGSAERCGAPDMRVDVIERLSGLLVTFDDLQTDALAISEFLSGGRQ